MSSLLNSSYSSLNNSTLLNEGGSKFLFGESECVVTTRGTLLQSSILFPSGFQKVLKRVTTTKQIIVKGV